MVFCGLVGRKFSKKSKHSVKCINSRIEAIRKKKQALVRYLKKDVADLLAGGHDENAFRRMNELIVEVNHASCYDLIEQYCGCVLAHLSTMRKERECPKEAMEAAATLIFAAARFSNLPELVDLRTVFTERYGSRMEPCINKEFIEKVHKKTFSKEKKLQLMEDIASEFSVNWNSKMFDNQISNQTSTNYVQLAKHKPGTKENDQHFHKEVSSLNKEPDSRMHESSPKSSSMPKHQSQHDEGAMNGIQRHRGDGRSSDSVFVDRTSANHSEISHSKASEDAKDAMQHNGEGGRDQRPVNAANCGMVNRQPPYAKYNLSKTPPDAVLVNPRDFRNSNGGRDNDDRKDGSVHSTMPWDYDKLAAEISALRNS